jgi:hypothetical protein
VTLSAISEARPLAPLQTDEQHKTPVSLGMPSVSVALTIGAALPTRGSP